MDVRFYLGNAAQVCEHPWRARSWRRAVSKSPSATYPSCRRCLVVEAWAGGRSESWWFRNEGVWWRDGLSCRTGASTSSLGGIEALLKLNDSVEGRTGVGLRPSFNAPELATALRGRTPRQRRGGPSSSPRPRRRDRRRLVPELTPTARHGAHGVSADLRLDSRRLQVADGRISLAASVVFAAWLPPARGALARCGLVSSLGLARGTSPATGPVRPPRLLSVQSVLDGPSPRRPSLFSVT